MDTGETTATEIKQRGRQACEKFLTELDEELSANVFGRLSGFIKGDLGLRIWGAGEGLIGNMAALIELAGTEAVRDMVEGKADCVTETHFARVFSRWGFGRGKPNPFLVDTSAPAAQALPPAGQADDQAKVVEIKRPYPGGRNAARDRNFRP